MRIIHKTILGIVGGLAVVAGTISLISPVKSDLELMKAQRILPPFSGVVNPDISQDNISQNICNKDWSTSSIRPPSDYTTKLKIQQMKDWRLGGIPAQYEEDHFIAIEDSGNPTDPNNLWPMALHINYQGYDLGAKTKDVLENKVHTLICNGTVKLNDVITIFDNWPFYYKQYIGDWPKYNGS